MAYNHLSPFLSLVHRGLPWFIVLFWSLFTAGCYYEVELVEQLQDFISVAVLTGAAVLTGMALNYMEPLEYRPWLFIYCSFYLHIIAESLWGYHVWVYGTDPEPPSVCDLFYTLDSLLLIVGMLFYLHCIGRLKMGVLSIDLVITAVIMAGLLYYFQVSPLWEKDYSFFAVLVKSIYPFFDLLLMYCLLYLFFTVHRAAFNARDLCLSLGLLLLCLGDELDLADALYELELDWFIEPLWSVPYLFFLLSALQPDPQRSFVPKSTQEQGLLHKLIDLFRISLPFLGTLFILGLGVIKYQLRDPLFWWGIVLVSLLSFKQILVIMYNRELLNTLSLTDEQLNLQNAQLHKLNEKISLDAKTDYLTGLYNRRHLDYIFGKLLADNSDCQALSVLIIDVDKFKGVNDSFGHQCGDLTLSRIAEILKKLLDEDGFAARYGGDEFMVLLKNKTYAQTEDLAAAMINGVREDETLQAYRITLSIGFSTANRGEDNCTAVQLLRLADLALYQAKQNGRDQYRASERIA